jgi:hypothetical protein
VGATYYYVVTALDGDGWTNYQEYLSCTAPDDGDSVPAAPTVPALNCPVDTGESDTRRPWLSVSNAVDADCQDLRYVFELYSDAELATLVAATAAEGENTTAWQVQTELAVLYYDTSVLAWVAVEIESIDPLNNLASIKTSHFLMYTIGASGVGDPSGGGSGGGGGGGCFIAAVARTEAAVFKTDWPGGSVFGLLALIGFLWLGRKKRKG